MIKPACPPERMARAACLVPSDLSEWSLGGENEAAANTGHSFKGLNFEDGGGGQGEDGRRGCSLRGGAAKGDTWQLKC